MSFKYTEKKLNEKKKKSDTISHLGIKAIAH